MKPFPYGRGNRVQHGDGGTQHRINLSSHIGSTLRGNQRRTDEEPLDVRVREHHGSDARSEDSVCEIDAVCIDRERLIEVWVSGRDWRSERATEWSCSCHLDG